MHKWWSQFAASLGIVALTIALAMGLPLVNKAISAESEVEGDTFHLNPGVTITPPSAVLMRPGLHQPQQGRAEFSVNSATVTVEAQGPYDRSSDYLLDEMERFIAAQPDVHLAESRDCVAGSVIGSGRTFLTSAGSGFLCAFVHDGVRVEVTASGTALDAETVNKIDDLIDSVRFGDSL